MPVEAGQRQEVVPAEVTGGTRTWKTEHNETVYACGCRVINTTPAQLMIWCGQPDCIRLWIAEVAYDVRQWQWQKAHGGDPELVEGLTRHMRTPLPQTVPPPEHPLDPPGVFPFGAEVAAASAEPPKEPASAPHRPPPQPPKH
jgi:hypothetical protein